MKKLTDILPRELHADIIGNRDVMVSGLALDSRLVQEGFLFAALAGTSANGNDFIDAAIKNGAAIILCNLLPENINQNITYITTENAAATLGKIARAYYGNPTQKLELVGITGTNGKTTVSSLLCQFFKKLGYKCGLISTIGIWINDEKQEATHTTPDVITLNRILSEMAKADCDFVFMEVSSHAIAQQRISGLEFRAGIFTNLTHDHLDYHGTFENYRNTKKSFFDLLDSDAFALTNADDKNGKFMLQNCKAARLTYALESPADFKAKIIEYDLAGMQLQLNGSEIFTTLSGKFNAYNILAAYATARMMDVDDDKALRTLSELKAPEGRFSCIRSNNGITGIVDYAHTPDALENILQTVSEINLTGGNIITVVGCGGNRDSAKRPVMAKIASTLSQKVILTSDNPRYENPAEILDEMEKGIPVSLKKNVFRIEDRRQAIKAACGFAESGDIVLVAGKGHEKYQDIKGVKTHFDDTEVLTEYLKEHAI